MRALLRSLVVPAAAALLLAVTVASGGAALLFAFPVLLVLLLALHDGVSERAIGVLRRFLGRERRERSRPLGVSLHAGARLLPRGGGLLASALAVRPPPTTG